MAFRFLKNGYFSFAILVHTVIKSVTFVCMKYDYNEALFYSSLNQHLCIFKAIYSIPTNMYPIPQATASLYFYFEVSRILPSNCPVVVIVLYFNRKIP